MPVIPIAITKAKKNISVDTDALPDEVYQAALAEGLKSLLNKNMSKITVKDLEGDELLQAQEAAFAKATESLENLMAGNLKRRKAAGKESREVTTEARRLAREAVKAAFREAGKKISGIKASVITAAADELIAEDQSYVEKARENVAKMKTREAMIAKPAEGTTLAKMIASAETAKPKVAPTRKKKDTATTEDVVAAKAKGKGKAQHATH
jgi:hypothetical protein